jgi:hypothetical protein
MLIDHFDQRELEALVRAAAELRAGEDPSSLSELQASVLDRAAQLWTDEQSESQ